MNYLSMLLLSVFLLTSCSTNTGADSSIPILRLTNTFECGNLISVSLVGYVFESLAIGSGESKTFPLTDGIPSGLDNVNVEVNGRESGVNGFTSDIVVNFANGQTTSIKAVPYTEDACNMRLAVLQLE